MKQSSTAQWPMISSSLDPQAVLCYSVCYTNNKIVMYALCRYLGSPFRPCHSVPCGNKQCCWSEVTRGWKQLLQLITGCLEKSDIGCLPVENVSKSSDIHIIPEWSNQWNTVIQWKPLRCVFSKWVSKWKNSICVYLLTKNIERSNSVAVIAIIDHFTIFISGSTKNQLLHCCS